MRAAAAAIGTVVALASCSGSDGETRDIESVEADFDAAGLPTLVALNRDADSTQRRTTESDEGTVEALLQMFSNSQPSYVRGLGYSHEPDPTDPAASIGGTRWIVYVLDTEEHAENFEPAVRAVRGRAWVRIQTDNVVVVAEEQFALRVRRALERSD